jgi:hypothetical protein
MNIFCEDTIKYIPMPEMLPFNWRAAKVVKAPPSEWPVTMIAKLVIILYPSPSFMSTNNEAHT